ncbi:transposase, partial [Streptococcus danieliae]
WELVTAFPSSYFVLDLSTRELADIIRKSTSKRISDQRVAELTEKLISLAKQSYCAVKKDSPMLEQARYYAQELLRLSDCRQAALDEMKSLAEFLPEYDILLSIPGIAETTATSIIGELGDIRRFKT